ncbi:MAG: CsgG/HfaB family protein, partial [Acidobacteriota bacterium]|nr:CsgG/HfaB family protein [Acidobacteriota bacterium]
MKQGVLLLVVCLSMVGFASSTGVARAETGNLRYTITVSRFENQAGWRSQWSLGDAWGTVLTDLLNKSGKFIVLAETDMREEALAEQDFVSSGRTAQGTKGPVTGQMTPAQILVKGAITHVQQTGAGGGGVRIKGFKVGGKGGKAEMNVTIYMVDSTTGQVIASESVKGESKRKGLNVGYWDPSWSAAVGGEKNDN